MSETDNIIDIQFKIDPDDSLLINSLNKLIEDKTAVNINFGIDWIASRIYYKDIEDFGIIVGFDRQYLNFFSYKQNFYCIDVSMIDSIIISEPIKKLLLDNKLNYLSELLDIKNDRKFIKKDYPEELKEKIIDFLKIKNFDNEVLEKFNCNPLLLLPILKEKNYIVKFASINYSNYITSIIENVNSDNFDLRIIDDNDIFITETKKLNLMDISYFFFNFAEDNILKDYFENTKIDKLSNTIEFVFPGLTFTNDYELSYQNFTVLVLGGKNLYTNVYNIKSTIDTKPFLHKISLDQVELINYLSDNLEYLDSIKNTDYLEVSSFELMLEESVNIIYKQKTTEELRDEFPLCKVIMDDTIRYSNFTNCKFSQFKELLILDEKKNYTLFRDISSKQHGYFIINNSRIKNYSKVYLSKLRSQRIKEYLSVDIEKVISNEVNPFELMVDNVVEIEHIKFGPVKKLLINNVDGENLIGTLLDNNCYPIPYQKDFKFKDIVSIKFFNKTFDEAKDDLNFIKDNNITIYDTLYQNSINEIGNEFDNDEGHEDIYFYDFSKIDHDLCVSSYIEDGGTLYFWRIMFDNHNLEDSVQLSLLDTYDNVYEPN